jgi:hypothetical protein
MRKLAAKFSARCESLIFLGTDGLTESRAPSVRILRGRMHVHPLFIGHGVTRAQLTGPLVVPSQMLIIWFLRFSVPGFIIGSNYGNSGRNAFR